MSNFTINLYTDDDIYSVKDFTTSLRIEHFINAPYSQATLNLRVPLHLQHDALPLHDKKMFDVGAWLQVFDLDLKTTVFLGRCSTASTGVEVQEDGLKDTIDFNVSFDSWLAPLIKGQVFLSGKSFRLNGHIFNIDTWGSLIMTALSTPFTTTDVGATLKTLWNLTSSYYRFPKTLLPNGTFFNVPIVHNQSTVSQYAPDRKSRFRSVFGRAINAYSSVTTGNTAWGLITSSFDCDPSVFELFPSLEPSTIQDGALGEVLKATPCIIYRVKPFIFDSVKASTTGAVNEKSLHPSIDAVYISASKIQMLSVNLSDENRVNAVYVSTPLNVSKGVETFGLVGSPVLDRADIEKHGMRLYKANYPFFPTGRSKKTTLSSDVNYVISLCSQIMLNSHRYYTGSANLLYDGSIRAGRWYRLQTDQSNTDKDLLVYTEKVEHSINVVGSNVIQSRTNIRFTRAFYAGEEP
jgi:hypothetical protein